MTQPISAFPLCWPAGWPRCQAPAYYGRFQTGIAEARDGIIHELTLLGARDIVISSNAELRRDGRIAAQQRSLDDPGVAVYFTLDGQQRCIPCDRWNLLKDNLQAIRLTIAALRGIERWGTGEVVSAAFAGFAALPAQTGGEAWWQVLEVAPTASEVEIEAAYRRLAKQLHPDVPGGDAELFRGLNAARAQAKGRVSA